MPQRKQQRKHSKAQRPVEASGHFFVSREFGQRKHRGSVRRHRGLSNTLEVFPSNRVADRGSTGEGDRRHRGLSPRLESFLFLLLFNRGSTEEVFQGTEACGRLCLRIRRSGQATEEAKKIAVVAQDPVDPTVGTQKMNYVITGEAQRPVQHSGHGPEASSRQQRKDRGYPTPVHRIFEPTEEGQRKHRPLSLNNFLTDINASEIRSFLGSYAPNGRPKFFKTLNKAQLPRFEELEKALTEYSIQIKASKRSFKSIHSKH